MKRAREPDEAMTVNTLSNEFLCPITGELPLDPVMAEDGRVYDRRAIERWFKEKGMCNAVSPMTGKPMGTSLINAYQFRNAIETMVKSGSLEKEMVDNWKRGMCIERVVQNTNNMADGGNAVAMRRLAFWNRDGRFGFKKDTREAVKWFEKASKKFDATATAALGISYINGTGNNRNLVYGIHLITRAAEMGSEHAAALLANLMEEGKLEFPKNDTFAELYYVQALSSNIKDSNKKQRSKAKEFLKNVKSVKSTCN